MDKNQIIDSIKNFPIQIGDSGEKPDRIKQERGLKLLCLFDDNGSRLNKLITFLC